MNTRQRLRLVSTLAEYLIGHPGLSSDLVCYEGVWMPRVTYDRLPMGIRDQRDNGRPAYALASESGSSSVCSTSESESDSGVGVPEVDPSPVPSASVVVATQPLDTSGTGVVVPVAPPPEECGVRSMDRAYSLSSSLSEEPVVP